MQKAEKGFNVVIMDLPFNNIESHLGLIQSNLLPSLLLLRDHEWGLAEFATTSPSFPSAPVYKACARNTGKGKSSDGPS